MRFSLKLTENANMLPMQLFITTAIPALVRLGFRTVPCVR